MASMVLGGMPNSDGSKETGVESLEKTMEQLSMIANGIFPSSCVNPEVYEKVKDEFKKVSQ